MLSFTFLQRRCLYSLLAGLQLFFFANPIAQAQTIRYVSATGTNSNPTSATSWATSTTNLQGAINASAAGDQVWVKTGLYKPTSTTARSISFAMKNSVAIYGGFTGTETTISQRPAIHLTAPSGTTLSGEIGDPNSTTDNCLHVIANSSGLTNTAVLDGFVITAGNANGETSSYPNSAGGGMLNEGNFNGQFCNPMIRNCAFVNNKASIGAAVHISGYFSGNANPTFLNCSFLGNQATFAGGALFTDGYAGNSSPVLTNCLFRANTANDGAAIRTDSRASGNSSPVLTNCTFLNNIPNGGAAIHNLSSGSPGGPTLTNCLFWNNGGAATIVNTAASLTATYSLFEPSVTGYTSVTGNLTTLTSPFADTATGQLAPCSPAINAGDPASTTATLGVTDLAGNARFFGNAGTPGAGTPAGRIDMGAFEFQDNPTISIVPPNGSSFTVCTGGTIELRAAISDFSISLNGAIATDFSTYTASFGPALSATAINGPIKFIGQLTDLDQGCAAYPAGTFAGQVAIIRRGTCGFATKVKNAQDAGAIGVLIYNNVAGETNILGGTDATITIPAAGLSKANGEAIIGALATGTVTAKSRMVSYSWAPGTGLSSTTGIAVNATPTQTTAYTVTASAPGVCSSQTVITVTVAPFPSITITASPSLSISPGQSITLTASGATSYTWSNGQTTNPLVIPSASPSTYTVTGLLGICQSTTAPTVTVSPPVCGSVIYVTPSGAGSQNGSSWTNAVPGSGLQVAINTAATCGTQAAAVSVWVANGLYKPALTPGNMPTDRTVSFSMRNGVTVYGGFVGTETALNQRPGINLTTPSGTTLSGEIGNPTSTTDNSYHVISNPTGLTTTAILDGFVITGGNANGPGGFRFGGGVYSKGYGSGAWCSPQIRNCLFLANSAFFGGAILNDGYSSGNSSPILTNCSFSSNTATAAGGAMYNDGSVSGTSSPILTNCSFSSNTATAAGGAMYNDGSISGTSSPTLTNCGFLSNTATTFGGAMFTDGRSNGNSSPVLTGCSFTGNIATTLFGGGIYSNGTIGGVSSMQLTNCILTGNRAANGFGGGIYNLGSSLSITRCMINENYASNGGGLVNTNAPLLMTNSMVRSNTTVFQASGIQISDVSNAILANCEISGNTSLTSQGGLLHTTNTSASSLLTLINCTIANNTSQGGLRAVWTNVNSTTQTARTVLKNTIVANNPNGNFLQQSSNTILQSQGFNLDSDGTSSFTNAVNGDLVGVNPLFVSATDLRLQATSPAINAGDPATTSALVGTTDLAGNPRFGNTRIDMGAYDFQGILEVFSLKDGLWNDATLWSVGRLPLATERVRLKHAVTIPTGHLALSGTLIYDPVSKLIYATGGRLQLGQ